MAYLTNEYARFGYVVVNVLAGPYVKDSDRELFFGPLDEYDKFIQVPDTWRLSKLLAFLGVVDSAKEAERRGWVGHIPEGFSDYKVGKMHHRIVVLKITKEEERREKAGT